MRDPDRYLPDPGLDDSPTDKELAEVAENVDIVRWVMDLANCVTASDFARFGEDCYQEIMDAVAARR